jgi:hypothetical protein
MYSVARSVWVRFIYWDSFFLPKYIFVLLGNNKLSLKTNKMLLEFLLEKSVMDYSEHLN